MTTKPKTMLSVVSALLSIKYIEKTMIKYLIHPDYEYLRPFIESLPTIFEQEGEVIYTGRNLIKVMQAEGLAVNVKRYRKPSLFNRIVYSFFRAPKGLRAFHYPGRLLYLGFETPHPIAYIEERSGGLIGYSYFVSVQSGYTQNFYQFGHIPVEQCRQVITEFARYTARLHEAGIYHRDYSPGNILFDKVDGVYHFSLVDINRMSFGTVGLRKGCANFARLWGQTPLFTLLADEYAAARNFDRNLCRKLVLKYRARFWKRYRRRHPVYYQLDIE